MGRPGDGRCWSIGDASPYGRRRPYDLSHRVLLGSLSEGALLRDHVTAVLDRAAPIADAIADLRPDMDAVLVATATFAARDAPLTLRSGDLTRAAGMRLQLDFDLYYDADG